MSAMRVSSDLAVTMEDVADEPMLFGPLPSDGRSLSTRLGVGEVTLPVDADTVERFVAQFIGPAVLCPAHMANDDATREFLSQFLRLLVIATQLLIFDAILAVHLFDEQFAIAVN